MPGFGYGPAMNITGQATRLGLTVTDNTHLTPAGKRQVVLRPWLATGDEQASNLTVAI